MGDPGDDFGESMDAIGKVRVAPRYADDGPPRTRARYGPKEERETYRLLEDLDEAHRATGEDRSIYSRAASVIRLLAADRDLP
jgi:hypothetical protein